MSPSPASPPADTHRQACRAHPAGERPRDRLPNHPLPSTQRMLSRRGARVVVRYPVALGHTPHPSGTPRGYILTTDPSDAGRA
eukprot:1176950-Prorocentrum_minimum.AAC.1